MTDAKPSDAAHDMSQIEDMVARPLQAVVDKTREEIKAAFSGRRYRARIARDALGREG